MKKPTIKIAVPVEKYASLHNLALSVIEAMTSNVNFPAPSPSIPALEAAAATLTEAIATWGPLANRGSKRDLMQLRLAATNMRNLLLKETAYVMNQVDLSASPEAQGEFIASSGFPVKNERSPQGILEAVRNFHHFTTRRLNRGQVKLSWEKPLNVTVNSNVKVYLVFRSATTLFSDAVFLDAATKTTFTDNNPIKGFANAYFILAFNNAGRGAVSEMVMVES
jgi:hypothetical protein